MSRKKIGKLFYVRNFSAFTLIELLVVIAILAILATVIVVIINPGELLKQSRDTDRMADMATMSKTLGLLIADQASVALGTSTNIYVSLPDSSPTCANLGLPTPPTGYSYACVSTSTYRKVDGTGWIPVNLTQLSSGSPLSRLPADPVNTTSTSLFYLYTPSSTAGYFEISTLLESQKYRYGGSLDKASTDGGSSSVYYEQGSSLTTNPINDSGLVGHWKFDEGTGTSASDSSGNNNTGTLTNGPTWQTGTSCKTGGCLSFDGVNDYVGVANNDVLNARTHDQSIFFWEKVQQSTLGYDSFIFKNSGYGGTPNNWAIRQCGTNGLIEAVFDTSSWSAGCNSSIIANTTWKYIGVIFQRDVGVYIYVNGILDKTLGAPPTGDQTGTGNLQIGGQIGGAYGFLNGQLDDVRIYNRALSAAEVLALYNASK